MDEGGIGNARDSVGGRRDPSAANAEGGTKQANATDALTEHRVLKKVLFIASIMKNFVYFDRIS
jgi:hypothetical protein